MQKRLHLVDTCIFIDLLRGNQTAIDFFKKYKGRIAISSISILELYRGAKTKEKKLYIQEFVKSFKHALIDKDTI